MGNGSSPSDEKNRHVIAGIEFVDEFGPFQIWTDLVFLEICHPHEVPLCVSNIRSDERIRSGGEKVHAL